MKSVEEIYIFIAAEDDGEGVCAFSKGTMMFPMVAADIARVDSMRAMARHIANESGRTITLAKFSERENLETIKPERKS